VALSLGPSVGHFIATDQEYVQKLVRENIESNAVAAEKISRHQGQNSGASRRQQQPQQQQQKEKKKKKSHSAGNFSGGKQPRGASAGGKRNIAETKISQNLPNVTFTALDWELDVPATLKEAIEPERRNRDKTEEDPGFDLLISCDCIYNEALVPPFVRTCADICRLRPLYHQTQTQTQTQTQSTTTYNATTREAEAEAEAEEEEKSRRPNPTVCVIAQQQRSPDVFETWLRETLQEFRVWRLSDEILGEDLKAGTGYVVHALVLRGAGGRGRE
jgi:hypothetical protein